MAILLTRLEGELLNMKNPVAIALIIIMLSLTLVHVSGGATPSVHPSGLPKMNEIWYKAYPNATLDLVVEEFLNGVTDWIAGPARKDLYDRIIAAGEKVGPMSPMAEWASIIIIINCRDYKGGDTSNWPLNESQFRIALSYIYGMDKKQADIYSYVQAPWVMALGNPVPPACKPYYDESVRMPDTDWDKAWQILQGAGYYVEDGYLKKDGKTVRNMEVWYSTGALFWERVGLGFVRAFNEFMASIGATNGPVITLLPKAFGALVSELFSSHNFDFICFGLTWLGGGGYWPCLDRLCDMLHSEGFWNFAGIRDPLFDEWIEIIRTSQNFTEVKEAASKLQYRFVYELLPWFPISYSLEFSTVARDSRGELMNLIPMPNYGSSNYWSWVCLHWKGTPGVAWPGGTLKRALDAEWHTMNPFTEDTPSGWQIMDRAIDRLLNFEPYNLTIIPYIATSYEITMWVSIPELGITNGSMVTFWLRQDVKWHDGRPVTAHDCVNTMRLMREYKPGRYSSTWSYLVYEEADGPYKFTAYYSQGQWWNLLYAVSETALLAPKHITDAIEKAGGNILEWNFTKPYKDLMGVDPPAKYSFMKQIVGCGPYVYDYADLSTMTAHVVKYDEYFVSAPAIGAVVGDWSILPNTAYTYQVLVQNIAAVENSEEGELTNVTVNLKIYLDDVLQREESNITLTPFSYKYFGPYTAGPFTRGSYGEHTIKVEVYDAETGALWHTYTHKFYVVPLADVTTRAGDNPALIDSFVDVMDILRAATAYGAYPGSLRWDPVCDIAPDYYFIDVMDLLAIVTYYGWRAPIGK
jgi:ABC-type transport system substrate-binding protein